MDEGICRYEGIEVLVVFFWLTDSAGGTALVDDDGATLLWGLLEEEGYKDVGSKLERD